MYYEHFRLTGEPFSLTPDPAFLFPSEKHREAMAAVQYGLLNGRGFVTLIGEVGTGKTTILYSVLSRLGPEIATAYVPYTAHRFDDLLRVALTDLGSRPAAGASRLELLEALQAFLLQRDSAGQRVALVIDEAQSLSDETFEELRLLSNFETYTHKLLQIVLVGQPELQDRLSQRNLRQLRQRVSVHAVINPLDADEMRAYIGHRLQQVRGDPSLFAPAALRAIVRHSQGIPRRANILCHNAMLFAFAHDQSVVTPEAAAEAIAEIDERRPGWIGRGALRRLPIGGFWRRYLPAGTAFAAGLALALALAWAFGRTLDRAPAADTEEPPIAIAPEAPVTPPVALPAPAPSAAPRPAPLALSREPVAAPAPSPDLAPAAPADEAAPAVEPAPDVSAPPLTRTEAPPAEGAARRIQMPAGGSILGVARDLYGASPDEREAQRLLDEVLRLNPELRDVNVVMAGAELRFPVSLETTEEQESATQ